MTPLYQIIVPILAAITHLSSSQTILNSTYTKNTRLTVSNSPYQVVTDVVIESDVIFEIENGVEIIFMDEQERTIQIKGHLIVGCNDIDTSLYNNRGLADSTTFTYIHSYDTDQRMGRMVLSGIFEPIVKICNAKIESLYQPLHFQEPGNAFVDNCEFNNNHQAIAYDSISDWTASQYIERVTQEVYDSIFRGNRISVSGHPIIDNIEVFNINQNGYVGDFYYATITNSMFNCGGAERSICLSLKGDNNTLSNNIIRNTPGDAIYVESFLNTITYNVIRGNQIGVKIDRDYQLSDLHYNDFVDNTINIQAFGWQYPHECSLNYYGTDNETEIAKSINDICDEFSSSVVIWWPYFSEPVADSSSLPDPVEVENLQCPASDSNDIARRVLPYVFPEDTILTVRDSPYYVTNNVFIQEGITLSIENGVEIIFTGDYFIVIRGVVDCGCSNIRKQPNDPKHRGLYLPNYIHIHSEEYNQEGDGFRFEDKGEGYFCHTLFESLRWAMYDNSVSGDAIISVENCEFKHNDHAMYGQTQSSKEVKDSIFESNQYAIRFFDYVNIDNCLFTLNKWGSITYCKDANVANSEINGRSQSGYYCIVIWYYSSSYFINNTVSNCDTGYRPLFILRDNTSSVQVMYNDFTNNVHAIEPHIDSLTVGDAIVSYNNFMNNTYAVHINMDSDFSMPYNYFGEDNVFNPQIISNIIRDDCDMPDQDPYDDGAAQFWPWLLSPVTSINDLPESYTIDAVRCPPISSPTSSPTEAPCDCNSIELLRIYTLRTDTICYKYETRFCNNDVRRFTMSVNEQSCGLSDISSLIKNIRPDDLMWSINDDGNIQIEDLMDGETFTFCLDSTKVFGTNPSGVIQYRIGNKWIGCRQIANVLPDYCGLS